MKKPSRIKKREVALVGEGIKRDGERQVNNSHIQQLSYQREG